MNLISVQQEKDDQTFATKTCRTSSDTAPTSAAAGIVSTQAHTMFVASPQRTALRRWMDPTPTIAPAMTCVVETGTFVYVAKMIDSAAAVSAQNPPRGFSF